ncbi:amino acid permease [Paenibacillus sp. 2TAB26]|uniref:amino acid permease n=1 Tax=Paenibacillus sp. 2TAB26 TaxID=3233005 RepID=UPI003F98CCA4
MILLLAGLLLFAIVIAVIMAIAFKAQQSISLSKHQNLIGYGLQAQLLQDKHDLHRYGLAQQLRRRFGGLSSFGLSFNVLGLIGSAAFLFGPAIGEGGPSVIGFGLPIIALFALILSASLAELSSVTPTAGGIYHTASSLGGRSWGVRAGWLQASGHLAMLALLNCACAALLDGFMSARIGYQTSDLTFWCVVAGLTASQCAVNHFGNRMLSKLQAGGVILQIFIALFIIAGLAWLAWPGSYSPVLMYQFQNAEWNGTVQAGSFVSGTLLLLKLFIGMEGSSQGSEETIDPRVRAPWSIFLSTAYTFVIGFVLLSFMLISIPLSNGPSWLGTFLQTAAAGWGGTSMIIIFVILSLWSSGLQTMTVCSRIVYSLARDGAMPLSQRWSNVSERHQTPIPAVWLCAVISLTILLIAFFSYRDDTIIFLLTAAIICLNLSYAIPIAWKIKQGKIHAQLHASPWHLGSWSIPIHVVSIAWLLLTTILAAIFIDYRGSIAAFVILTLISFMELRYRQKHGMSLQSRVNRSRKELYFMERKFPLN